MLTTSRFPFSFLQLFVFLSHKWALCQNFVHMTVSCTSTREVVRLGWELDAQTSKKLRGGWKEPKD